jgi:VWFA-related protein
MRSRIDPTGDLMSPSPYLKLTMLLLLLVCPLRAVVPARQDGMRVRDGARDKRGAVRSVTIPVTISVPLPPERGSEELRPLGLGVLEDGEQQEILATRSQAERAPLYLAVLVQDDLIPPASNEIATLANFIRKLPEGSYVMVGYMRVGSLQVRQRFTTDLERAAKALRIPGGTPAVGPYNPYSTIVEALKRYQSQPLGRRAILAVTDGLDVSRGVENSVASQSTDLQRAIDEAQRRSVAVYSIYTPTANTSNNFSLVNNAQGALERLSNESGGKAFFQGTGAPVSFNPFLRDITAALDKQIALTYLSTHSEKGFHKVKLEASLEGAQLKYPSGYTRK